MELLRERYLEILTQRYEQQFGERDKLTRTAIKDKAMQRAYQDREREVWHAWNDQPTTPVEFLTLEKQPTSGTTVANSLRQYEARKSVYKTHPIALAISKAVSAQEIANIIRQSNPASRYVLLQSLIQRALVELDSVNIDLVEKFRVSGDRVDYGAMVPLLRAASTALIIGPNDPLEGPLNYCYGKLDLWSFNDAVQIGLGVIGVLTLCALLTPAGPMAAVLLSLRFGVMVGAVGIVSAVATYNDAVRLQNQDKLDAAYDPFEGTIEIIESDMSVGWSEVGLALEILGALTLGGSAALEAVAHMAPRARAAGETAEALSGEPAALKVLKDRAGGGAEQAARASVHPPPGQAADAAQSANVTAPPLTTGSRTGLVAGDVEGVLRPLTELPSPRSVTLAEIDEIDQIVEDLLAPQVQYPMVLYHPPEVVPPLFEPPPMPVSGTRNSVESELFFLRGTDREAALFDLANETHNVPMTSRERAILEATYGTFWRKLSQDADTIHEIRLWATATEKTSMRSPTHRAASGVLGEMIALHHIDNMPSVHKVTMIRAQSVAGSRWSDYTLVLDDGAETAMEVRTVTMEPRMVVDPETGHQTLSRMDWEDDVTLRFDDGSQAAAEAPLAYRPIRRAQASGGVRAKIRHRQISPENPGFIMVVIAQEVPSSDSVISPRQIANLQRLMQRNPHVYGAYLSYRTPGDGVLQFIPSPHHPNMRLD